jgi:putative transport protein
MNWLLQMHAAQPVAHAIAVPSLVCVAGMAVGSLKVRAVGLGTAGVLFAGILTGYFGRPVDHATLEFVKEFGLILCSSSRATTAGGSGTFALLAAASRLRW